MRNRRRSGFIGMAVLSVLIMCLFLKYKTNNDTVRAAEVKYGYIHVSDFVYFRSGAGIGNSLVKDDKGNYITLYGNQKVRLLSETAGTDGYQWYNITVDYNGKTYKGYVRSDYVQDYTGTYDEKYAKTLTDKGFPESYVPALCYLHSLHPEWVFTPYFTGGGTSLETSLDWNASVEGESVLGCNIANVGAALTSHGMTGLSRSSWLSQEEGAYSYKTDRYTSFDSGYFAQVSDEYLSYYMDPRNFLSEKGILMFESQAYNPEIQTLAGIRNMLKGTFMEDEYEEGKKYEDLFVSAAEASGVSPYILIGRIFTEQGKNGAGSCISGKYPGYEGYYNHFDVGAWETTDAATGRVINAVENGLRYASMTDESLLRPWDSIEKSITGGAIFIGRDYTRKGQINAYLLKYNVTDYYTYWHQYMGAVICPSVDAYIAYQNYTDDGTPIDFQIPVFKNMPEEPCEKPMEYGCVNSCLTTLAVSGTKIANNFGYNVTEYSATVGNSVTSVEITASAACSLATISGTGTKELKEGKNTFEIVVTAENGTKTKYTVTITREASNTVNVESITLNKDSLVMTTIMRYNLFATVKPSNATDKTVTWVSGNKDVVTVSDTGFVVPLKPGKATLSAKSSDGKASASCEVTVEFGDVRSTDEDYYYTPVYWAVDKGITNGYTDTYPVTFKPEDVCTREQMVTFLWRMAGKPEPENLKCKFSDVEAGSYYYKAVLWATEQGITKGYEDGRFGVGDYCLREHAITFLWRMAGSPAAGIDNPFSDVGAKYYRKAVLWASANGITKGYTEGSTSVFKPEAYCERAQIVTFLYRFSKL